jgi:glycolate oxidase iron-sulfur subunit
MFRDDEAWRGRAERIAGLALDVSELLLELGLEKPAVPQPDLTVAYHDACSLQHAQKLSAPPRQLLRAAGFELREVPEGHLCCGSAGTYNMLQPELAGRLGRRKAANLETSGGAVVAVGNLGCLVQISQHSALPVVHTVELLDWATGGPRPRAMGPGNG